MQQNPAFWFSESLGMAPGRGASPSLGWELCPGHRATSAWWEKLKGAHSLWKPQGNHPTAAPFWVILVWFPHCSEIYEQKGQKGLCEGSTSPLFGSQKGWTVVPWIDWAHCIYQVGLAFGFREMSKIHLRVSLLKKKKNNLKWWNSKRTIRSHSCFADGHTWHSWERGACFSFSESCTFFIWCMHVPGLRLSQPKWSSFALFLFFHF